MKVCVDNASSFSSIRFIMDSISGKHIFGSVTVDTGVNQEDLSASVHGDMIVNVLPLTVRNMWLLDLALHEFPFMGDIILSMGEDGILVSDDIAAEFLRGRGKYYSINIKFGDEIICSFSGSAGLFRCIDDFVHLSRNKDKENLTAKRFFLERNEFNDFADMCSMNFCMINLDLRGLLESALISNCASFTEVAIGELILVFVMMLDGKIVITDPCTLVHQRFPDLLKKKMQSGDMIINLSSSIYPFRPRIISKVYQGKKGDIDIYSACARIPGISLYSRMMDGEVCLPLRPVDNEALFCELEFLQEVLT